MPSLTLIEARSAAERRQAFDVRRRVFVDEQEIAERLEFDGHDTEAWHLLALAGEDAVGTLRVRLMEAGRTARIERVAVLARARGSGVGLRLVRAALDLARAQGAKSALLHAQTRAQGFYARLGFEAFGPEFVEDGIAHIPMRHLLARETMPKGEDEAPPRPDPSSITP